MAKEKMNKRSVAAGLVTAALAFGVVGGSLAYLQDSTETIKNKFTYGAIDIELTEAVVNEYGVANDTANDRTSIDQTYKLVPKSTYTKDPVVTVKANSEPSYVYLVVDNPITALEDANTVDSQILAAGWTKLAVGEGETLYRDGSAVESTETIYYKTVALSAADQDLASFTTLNIGDVDVSAAGADSSIDVKAYAVQTESFDTALAAWAATFGQAPNA